MRRPADRAPAALWVRLAKCYGLVLRAVLRDQTRRRAAVTLPQFDVLAQLARHPEGMTPGALSRALLVTAGNVTGIVARLAARGFLRRGPHPIDRRARWLVLTPRGRRLVRKEVARHERALARILAGLAGPGRARVLASLGTLRDALERRSA